MTIVVGQKEDPQVELGDFPDRRGDDHPQKGNGNSNGNGNRNGNGDGDEGDESSISSYRGPSGPQRLQGPLGPQGLQGPQGFQGDRGLQGPPGRQGIQGIPGERGPWCFRGLWGQTPAVSAGQPQMGPNITTLDTTGLETSFQAMGDAMNQIAQQQQIANAQLNHSLK